MSDPSTKYLVAEVTAAGLDQQIARYEAAIEFTDQLEARAYAETMAVRTGRVYEVFMVVELR